MSVSVPDFFQVPSSIQTKVGRAVSSLSIGLPCQNGCNYLLGNSLGGLRAMGSCDTSSKTASPTMRFKTYRHPNCSHLGVFVIGSAGTSGGTIDVTVGTGATESGYVAPGSGYLNSVFLVAPFGSSDSGDVEVLLEVSDLSIRSYSVFDMPRAALESTDDAVFGCDSTYSRIGQIESLYLAESDETGPHGIIQQVNNSWDYYNPQIITWAEDTTNAFSTTSTSYVDLFAGSLRHTCRQKKSGTTTTDTRWHIYSKCSSGSTYKIYIYSGTDDYETADLNNSSYAWQSAITIGGDNSGTDNYYVQVKRTSGTGTIYVAGVSGIEES